MPDLTIGEIVAMAHDRAGIWESAEWAREFDRIVGPALRGVGAVV